MNTIIIAGLILIFVCILYPQSRRQTGGGLELSFSQIDQDISKGNSVSWSGRENVGGPTWRARPEFQVTPGKFEPLTIYGQVPLGYETRRSYKGEKINPQAVPNMNPKCSPGCCPSSYSCDSGCVCYEYRKKAGKNYF